MLNSAMFDWNDLRHLLAVAREGSTHAAAKALDVSQPTVQRRLAALEESVGRKLVERHPTGYRLTELGKALLPHAEDVERSVEAFQRQLMAEGEELTATLRVTCPEGMASRLLAPVIETFREKYPELRVDLIMTDHRLDLAKGEAEVALRMHEPGDDSLIARRIANSPWAVFASQSYIKRTAARSGGKIWTSTPLSSSPASWPTITPHAGCDPWRRGQRSQSAATRCSACWPP
jgi:molybdate transport repressor ModE-like protein